VARALVACGVAKDTRVGILMTNRPKFLAAALSIGETSRILGESEK
jgi:long-subunit acyl-CoA synthetase (AMP-forming)